MRRGIVIVFVLFVLGAAGISAGAYNAGERRGAADATAQIATAQANGQEVQVVHVVDDFGQRGPWFPGFFLFPLFLFGLFFLIGGIFRGAGRWGGHGPHGKFGPGPWNEEGRKRFEDRARAWHREEHGGSPPEPTATV